MVINLGVDPKQSDQMVRGTVVLPNGLGKSKRVLVLATGEKVREAQEAGADFVGGDDMVQKIQEGWTDFEAVIATPDMMRSAGRLGGKVLGPRGLMPNPKTGTVTFEVANALKEIKAGKVEFRVDKTGIIHSPVGKMSFDGAKLAENAQALLGAVIKAKPAAAKGRYVKKITLTSTMGPGIPIDLAEAENGLSPRPPKGGRSMKKRNEKKEDVEKLKSDLAKVSTVILTTFQGITVAQDTQLRRAVQSSGGKYRVVKNTLAEKAGAGTPAEGLLKGLSGTNSIAYSTDPVALAKILTKVAKDVPAFRFKAGVVEGRLIDRRNSAISSPSVQRRADRQNYVLAAVACAAQRHCHGRHKPESGRSGAGSGGQSRKVRSLARRRTRNG